MEVILVSGKAQHGKDTTAVIISKELEKNGKKAVIAHYADLVKYVCKAFFEWNGEKDEAGRTLLQHVGTDIVRKQDPYFWVQTLFDFVRFFDSEWDYLIIPDCRFPNEVDFPKFVYPTTLIRVVRDNVDDHLTESQRNHPSETALDDYTPDVYIKNNGTLQDLEHNVAEWVQIYLHRGSEC